MHNDVSYCCITLSFSVSEMMHRTALYQFITDTDCDIMLLYSTVPMTINYSNVLLYRMETANDDSQCDGTNVDLTNIDI